jgi:hypothetical protein
LFDTNPAKRKDARKTFCQHIDNVISACYGPELIITHRCIDGDEKEQNKVDIPVKLFRERTSPIFDVLGTKIYVTKPVEALCIVLTVNKKSLPLTLLTKLYRDGKTV